MTSEPELLIGYKPIARFIGIIPRCIDHDLCAHSRSPMDIIFQG